MKIRGVVEEHLEHLAEQVRKIIQDGVARGEFEAVDPAATAQAMLIATSRFHNPAHKAEWSRPDTDMVFEEVWSLLLKGLSG